MDNSSVDGIVLNIQSGKWHLLR